MKIKKSSFSDPNSLKTWNNLVDNYLPDFDETNRLQMDEASLTFSLLVEMHYQIMNGGIVQFIDNRTGDYFHETLDAARRINFSELVNILVKAAQQFPNGNVPTDFEYRRELWDQMGEEHLTKGDEFDIVDAEWEIFWENLDKTYYANEKKLYLLTINYLKDHATLAD